jgi:hypothetical protein
LAARISRSSHTESGRKPRCCIFFVKPVSRDSGSSTRGVMKLPAPRARRIKPCSTSSSIALRAVMRDTPIASESVRSEGSASPADHTPQWIAVARLRASCR